MEHRRGGLFFRSLFLSVRSTFRRDVCYILLYILYAHPSSCFSVKYKNKYELQHFCEGIRGADVVDDVQSRVQNFVVTAGRSMKYLGVIVHINIIKHKNWSTTRNTVLMIK